MKKELVLFIIDDTIYQVDVADPEMKVDKFFLNNPLTGNVLISFQTDEIVNKLGSDALKKINILDLECLDKQIRQSVGLTQWAGQWSVSNMIATYLAVEEREWRESDYEELLKQMTVCYLMMKEKGQGEWKRIIEIEIPINKILYELQSKGIFVNHKDLYPRCEALHRKKYEYKNIIQENLGYAGDQLDNYLNLHGIKHKILNDTEIKRLCKLYPELNSFWQLKKVDRDLGCLMMLSSIRYDSDVCKPLIKGFGTTTGRIMMRDPALQNLSRKFRDLLKDDHLDQDYRYEYVDFGQFEAGILAGLTKNKKLQELYEKDELYERLAAMSKSDRDTAKIYFYSFVYGGIVSKGTEEFFDAYGLNDVAKRIESNAFEKGYVETSLGNKRVVKSKDDKTWILNHLIQGTSSLIFKQSLLNVSNSFHDKAQLILPMHDAALYRVHKDVGTDQIVGKFKEAFIKWIPGSKPVVKVKDFFKGE